MHTFVKRALWGVVLGGGIAVLGATVANAAETDGSDGLLSSTQALIGVSAPVTVSGNSLAVIGDSASADAGTAPPASASAPAETVTSGSDGTASGTQALISVEVPITVSGTGLSVIGDSVSEGSTAAAPAAPSVSVAPATDGESGILSGTQALVDVALPVTVGGNAISVLGDSSTTDAATTAAPTGTNTAGATTTGDDGTASGTQVVAPVTAPVTAGGNAISVLGDSTSTDAGNTTAGGTTGGTDSAITTGDDGTASGTQVVAPVTAPVTVGGNAISVLGDSTSTDATTGTAGGTTGGTDDTTTTGDNGIASGTQVVAPVTAPVTAGGNAISVLGDSESTGSATVVPATTGSTGPATSGQGAILGGTQVALPVTAPITLGGNAIAVVGDSTTTGPVTVPGTTDPGTTDPGTTNPGTPDTSTPSTGTTVGASLATGVANGLTAAVRPLAQTGGTDLTVGLLAALGLIAAGLVALFTRRTVRLAAQR